MPAIFWFCPLFRISVLCCPVLKTLFCPCVVYGEIKEALHGGEVPDKYCCKPCACFCWMCLFAPFCIPCCLTGKNRRDIRSKYSLKPDCCGECCTHTFCGALALMQERREFKKRPLSSWPVETVAEDDSNYQPPAPEKMPTHQTPAPEPVATV
eukprot:evm.model.scf_3342.2 EVM.evm.TU.scf_3342.2   scf_3342:6591-7639(-)